MFLALVSLWTPLQAQNILDRLPADIRQRGEAILEQADAKRRAALADALARSHAKGARDFLLALVEQEQSALVRRTVLDRLGRINDSAIRMRRSCESTTMRSSMCTMPLGEQYFLFGIDLVRNH